jgi:hypothetical protein
VRAVGVEGSAADALATFGVTGARWAEVGVTGAAELLAWAAASGGARGRRRGAAAGRFDAWWVLAVLSGTADDWPADPGPAAEDLRVAEAQAARDRVLERFPEPATARFLIVGDFNDTPGSRTLKAMQARGKTDIATWLDAADERGHRWTHAYARIGVYSRFDQALIAEGLRLSEPANVVARVAGEPWAEVAAASDHRPLVVRVRTRPAQAAGTVD